MMYLKIWGLLIFISICSANLSPEDQWKKFKVDFNKQYEDDLDRKYFEVFKKNLQEIEDHNKLYEKGLVTYKKGVTKFADLTGEEFIKIYKLRQGLLSQYENPFKTHSNSTGYLNWKDKGAVSKVKDQGICGACWIFSAVGVIEGNYFRKNNKTITLSDQNLIDCLPHETCQGGYPPTILEYLLNENNGINTAEDYPHKGMRGACRYDKSKKVKLAFTNFKTTICNEEQLKDYLEKYGPIGIAISANGDWRLYESGIWFEKFCSSWPNHAVLLVGYGTENGKDYWLIKNSYGKEWGLSGYIKIARGVNQDYCGIETFAMFIQ